MATITAAITEIKPYRENGHAILWETLTNGDSGSSIEMPGSAIRSVQVTGTFGAGGTVVIQGSNDGSNWVTLNDIEGNALSLTAAGIESIQEVTRYIRPSVTAGDGTTDLDVTLVLVRRGK